MSDLMEALDHFDYIIQSLDNIHNYKSKHKDVNEEFSSVIKGCYDDINRMRESVNALKESDSDTEEWLRSLSTLRIVMEETGRTISSIMISLSTVCYVTLPSLINNGVIGLIEERKEMIGDSDQDFSQLDDEINRLKNKKLVCTLL